MDRRSFLKTTAATVAGASLLKPKISRAATPPNRFVFVNMGGGWDSTYSIDPKPGMATVSQAPGLLRTYGNLNVWDWKPATVIGQPDSNVKKFFDAWSSMSCIVKGINLRSISHDLCAQRIYTGRQGGTNPDMATIIGFEKHKDLPVPFLLISGPSWAGPLGAAVGRVGETGQLRTLIDPASASFPVSWRPDANDEIDIETFHMATAERQRAIRGSMGYNQARIQDFEDSLVRADTLRDKGKTLNFGGGGIMGQVDTALQVFQLNLAGCVMIDSGYGFDTHSGNISQGPSQDGVFAGLNYLMTQLSTLDGSTPGSKMIDETCVIVLSEMTRTPRLNGANGKDHWPVGACLMMGAGVAQNRQVGETGDGMVALPLDLATGATTGSQNLVSMGTEMFVAGVLTLAGIDSTTYFGSIPPLTALVG